jgi:predicted Zn finger-like uncharacterized protein
MTDFASTRCPGCRTVFRVPTGQLALRAGQVRCGQCRAVFDANDHLVEHPGDGETRPKTQRDDDAPAQARAATVAPDASETPEPVAPATSEAVPEPSEASASTDGAAQVDPPAEVVTQVEVPDGADASPKTHAETPAPAARERSEHTDTDATAQTDARSETPAGAPIAHPRDYEWRPRRRLREQPTARYALAVVALVGLLGAQLLFEYRNALAAHAPLTRPLLEAACRAAQCEIAPLRDASALSIEASDLQADPAHKGLLKLTATLRNRAAYAIAYPYLELTLTDPSDAVVARRAFPPAAYAPATAGGIAGNGELVVTMFFDASATSQAGYRLYLFYP